MNTIYRQVALQWEKRLAPSYANLFMVKFEDKYVYTYKDQPYWWKRYIDDIFLLWPLGKPKLDMFVSYLNSCHPTIKFTAHISEVSVDFLDTIVQILQNGTLITNLFTKPTDSHNYLHYCSCHPHDTEPAIQSTPKTPAHFQFRGRFSLP